MRDDGGPASRKVNEKNGKAILVWRQNFARRRPTSRKVPSRKRVFILVYVREVMYLPGLKENLLSVGQMDEHGYFLLFGGGMCSVFDGPSLDCLVIKVKKKGNRCYPLSFLSKNQIALRTSVNHSAWVWHRRFGHLHFGGLK